MNVIKSQMYVLSGGSVWGTAYDIETLNEILTSLANEHGEAVMKAAKILNVLHEIPSVDVFPLEYVPGELYIGDAGHYNDDDEEWTINDGDYSGRTFSSEDDIKSFLWGKIQESHMTVEDAKELDISCERTNSIRFNDVFQEDGEWRIDMEKLEPKHTVTLDAMAIEYVTAEEAAYLETKVVEARKPEQMSCDEIQSEINTLEQRIAQLYREQRLRNAIAIATEPNPPKALEPGAYLSL